jgi:cell wall-associated NlpC family hydrolase
MFSFLLASFFYIVEPTVFLRETPSDKAEVVSELFFSETVTPLAKEGEWTKVENTIDKYQGWLPTSTICERETPYGENNAPTVAVARRAAHLYTVEDTVFGPLMTLPFESRLELLAPKEKSNSRWLKVKLPDEREAYIQRGDIVVEKPVLTLDEMVAFSKQFQGLPYTWGGRSSFGYDCSGFTQMLYRQMGISIPRDSKDLVRWDGFTVVPMDSLKPGDVIIFSKEEGKGGHVGLYIGEGRFIHSTVAQNMPYLRTSSLSEPEWNGAGRYPFRSARRLKNL